MVGGLINKQPYIRTLALRLVPLAFGYLFGRAAESGQKIQLLWLTKIFRISRISPRQEPPKNIPRPPPTDAIIALASYKKNSSDVTSKSDE